jgi:hypothetical protein
MVLNFEHFHLICYVCIAVKLTLFYVGFLIWAHLIYLYLLLYVFLYGLAGEFICYS